MNTMQEWIAHLQNPLVLAGFGLFIFAALLRPLFMRSGKLTGKEAAPLLNKAVNFIFILALLAIIGGLALSWKEKSGNEKGKVIAEPLPPGDMQIFTGRENTQPKPPVPPPVTQPPGLSVSQTSSGDQSPPIISGGNVGINVGKAPAGQKKDDGKKDASAASQQVPLAQVRQESKGEQSPPIDAQGDVEVNYAK